MGDGTEESGSVGGASSSPMSEGGVEGGEGDWEPPVLKQPSVLARQAVLTPRQRAELRKFSRDDDKDDTTDVTEIGMSLPALKKPGRTTNELSLQYRAYLTSRRIRSFSCFHHNKTSIVTITE